MRLVKAIGIVYINHSSRKPAPHPIFLCFLGCDLGGINKLKSADNTCKTVGTDALHSTYVPLAALYSCLLDLMVTHLGYGAPSLATHESLCET